MNVFCLDKDPYKSAEYMCDKHIVKMIIETCQLLSATLDCNWIDYEYEWKDPDKPSQRLGCVNYPPAHIKHPSTLWVRKARGNYIWLTKHLEALNKEYWKRYNRVHVRYDDTEKYDLYLDKLNFEIQEQTPFTIAITDKRWHLDCPIESYRLYYNMEKFVFAKWKLGNVPEWFTGAPVYEVSLES